MCRGSWGGGLREVEMFRGEEGGWFDHLILCVPPFFWKAALLNSPETCVIKRPPSHRPLGSACFRLSLVLRKNHMDP